MSSGKGTGTQKLTAPGTALPAGQQQRAQGHVAVEAALSSRSRESSGGSAGGRIRPADVRVSASQLAAAASSSAAAFAAVREGGSLTSSPAKDVAGTAAAGGGPNARACTGGAAAAAAGLGTSSSEGSSDAGGIDEASRRATLELAGGPSVGRLPEASARKPTAAGGGTQPLPQAGSAPGLEFSNEGQTFIAPRLLPQEQQLLPARFTPHPPAQPPAPLQQHQPGQPLQRESQSAHAAAPPQRCASPAATALPHHPAIPPLSRMEDAEPSSSTADGTAATVSSAGSLAAAPPVTSLQAGMADSHRSPPLGVQAVRVPARAGAPVQGDVSRGPAITAAEGPHDYQQLQQAKPQSAETPGSHLAAASVADGAGAVTGAGLRPPSQGVPQSGERAADVAAANLQAAAGVSGDTPSSARPAGGDLQQPVANLGAGSGTAAGAPRMHSSTGVGSSGDDYSVRAQGREAALSEDVLAAAIAAARASAQAAFFSPGAPRALPRQAGYSGRVSGSGTPASPGGSAAAHYRQPLPVGGVSAAAAPYVGHSPGAVTPGTGTAASSVRSGFSPVRSPYDLLLHGGLTSAGPAAVLLPVGPGSDTGRGTSSNAVPPGAARAAWSTASTAGGSSVGGGGGRMGRTGGARGAEAMGAEFFRRNNLLQRKRQEWTAQGQREREGESGVSAGHHLAVGSAGTAVVNKPHAPPTGEAKTGTAQAPIRSLEDLQRWAQRRDQRLAVLREEREEAERQLQESHPFRPTITEKSRRMVEAARARSPELQSRRPWAASPAPGQQQQQQPQQPSQQGVTPVVAVPPPAAGDLLNALRGSRPWHTPPQVAAVNAAAASLRSSVAAAAAAELLNGSPISSASVANGAGTGDGRTPVVSGAAAVAKTPGKATATTTPSRAGASGAAGGGGGMLSAAALLTAARHSKSRGRYASAAETEAVVGAVAEAIEDAAAALRRTIDGSISPRRSASGLATRLRTSVATNDVSAGGSVDAAAPVAAAAAAGTKRRMAEPPAVSRQAPGHSMGAAVNPPAPPGYQAAGALVHQPPPQDAGSYAATYGAHHEASASAGLHYASQSPTLGTQPGVFASTYYPVPAGSIARGVGSSGGGAGGSGGGAMPPGVASASYTVVPDPRQPFPGYGVEGSSGGAATAFGVMAAQGTSRPVSNSSWAAELMSGSRGGNVAAASAAAVSARQGLAVGSGSRRNTRSTGGVGGTAVVAIAARRTSSSGGTGGGSGGGAAPGSVSPVQRPQAPLPQHSPSPSASPIPAFASPMSAVRGNNNNNTSSGRMSRARVSWSDLVSGGGGDSGSGAAGVEPISRRSAAGASEAVDAAGASPALNSAMQPTSAHAMGTVGALRSSFDGAASYGLATPTRPATAGQPTTAVELPVATSSFILPFVAGRLSQPTAEVGTPRAALPGAVGGELQQDQQQGTQEARPGPQAEAATPPTAPTPDTHPYSAGIPSRGSAASAVAAAMTFTASSTAESPGSSTRHDSGAGTAGGVEPTLPMDAATAAAGHAAAGVQTASHGEVSSRPHSGDASGGGAASEPSFATMHPPAARSATAASSSGGGAMSATRGWSPGGSIASVFEAASFTLDQRGHDAGQAQPPATPPLLTPAPEEQNAEAMRQRQQELEGRKDSLAAALEAALLAAAAAATAAAASAEKGRKLAAGGDAVATDAPMERMEALAAAHTEVAPAAERSVDLRNDVSGSGTPSRVEGTVTAPAAPSTSASVPAALVDADSDVKSALLLDSEPSSVACLRNAPLSSVHSSEGAGETPVLATVAPAGEQPAAGASDVPAPPVSQMALATAAALAMRARSETSLRAVAAPGAAAAASAALGLAGPAGEELAVPGLVASHSGPILTVTASGPAGVPAGATSMSAGGAAAAALSPSHASASVAAAPRGARGVAFARLPSSNPSSAASTPRKMSASLSMSAAHSLAAAAHAAAAVATGATSSAGGAPPPSPPVSQHSAMLRGYASAGGAADMHPRPASPLRRVENTRKQGLALPHGVDGLTLSSTPPASPPNGAMTSAATAAALAAGIVPAGASSSRRRSSLLSAGGSVERPLVQVSLTSPQPPAQADNSAGMKPDAPSPIRSAASPSSLVLASLMPQQQPEVHQRQEREQQPAEQQVAPSATDAHGGSSEGESLQTLLRRIEALRSGSANANSANANEGSDARVATRAGAGPAASGTAALAPADAADPQTRVPGDSAGMPMRLSDRIGGPVSAAPLAAVDATGAGAEQSALHGSSRGSGVTVASHGDKTGRDGSAGASARVGAAELSLDALVRRAELARAAALMAASEPAVQSSPPPAAASLQSGAAPASPAARSLATMSPSTDAATPRHRAMEADAAGRSPVHSAAQSSVFSTPRPAESPGPSDKQDGAQAPTGGAVEPMRSSWSLADYVSSIGGPK
ncbi:hypothetical protein HXX76_007734 [Chlamydomonas incerta]|uniref:Uncharacterized protein n=1 Tax=Chlamydomonas incerta TaxID=51695 RepID=A0A835W2P3_CHLIN|nr:hypothetical protein HXX76_007734 [Chlamydomonas incerta]|eukprot:KAG2434849.1 hypothetical protein HXX76_007734 [Chlamydomonas incerta]